MKRNREGDDNAPEGARGFFNQRTETSLSHPFKANFNDHFETSIVSLRDIFPFLDELRQLTRPSCPEAFTLYDPYYCTGKVKQTWALPEFGITKVIHENRDFYDDVKKGIAPPQITRDEVENVILDIGEKPANYDVCVTNPPYSENHIERFMKNFAIPSKKPWAMLVPDYIPTKHWYINLIEGHYTPAPVIGRNVGFDAKPSGKTGVGLMMGSSIPRMIHFVADPEPTPESNNPDPTPDGAQEEEGNGKEKGKGKEEKMIEKICQEPFYIVPKVRYEFEHPVHAGRERSHFKSLWIVSGGRRTTELLKSVKAKSDPSRTSVASGRVEFVRQTAAPGTAGSVALIPNAPRKITKHNNSNRGGFKKY